MTNGNNHNLQESYNLPENLNTKGGGGGIIGSLIDEVFEFNQNQLNYNLDGGTHLNEQ